ncbi:MAG: hypothetical protein ABSG67_02600 [Thermoguttaceae bacterium]|jgi:hypothetical protein
MSLEQWLQNGWLQKHNPTLPEIHKLFQIVDRDLSDAEVEGLSADGKFEHAYDAALQLCMIPLTACGYKVPKGSGKHKRVIESLSSTLGHKWIDPSEYLERCSRLRGQAIYDRINAVSKNDANDLLLTAKQLRTDVIEWLKVNYSAFVPLGI